MTDTGRMVVRQHGVVVADIPAPALTDDAPVYQREARRPAYLDRDLARGPPRRRASPDLDARRARRAALPRLLAHPTIASKRWIYRQYDHMVQHGTVVLPGSDAGVVRLRLGDSEKFIAISNDCNGRYCYLNPQARRPDRDGGVPAQPGLRGGDAARDDGQPQFREPLQARELLPAEGMRARASRRPAASSTCRSSGGNVSLYNESPEGAIDPTPTVSVVGFIEEEAHITRQFARGRGRARSCSSAARRTSSAAASSSASSTA